MNEHTPTPWGWGTREKDTICGDGGAGLVLERRSGESRRLSKQDWDFALRAVNSHDDLLAACKAALAALASASEAYATLTDCQFGELPDKGAADKLLAAIAKATGATEP